MGDEGKERRRILVQLNCGEGRHSLSRAVFHGQKGELRQRYRPTGTPPAAAALAPAAFAANAPGTPQGSPWKQVSSKLDSLTPLSAPLILDPRIQWPSGETDLEHTIFGQRAFRWPPDPDERAW